MRADSVAQALIQRGISADRVEAVGRGPDMPVASNATAEGRQQNRRVEILFSDDAGRFRTSSAR
jgi:outer membrane protein OmpA-like peptidoglycan-associated protein